MLRPGRSLPGLVRRLLLTDLRSVLPAAAVTASVYLMLGCSAQTTSEPAPASISDATMESSIASGVEAAATPAPTIDLGSLESQIEPWQYGHFDGRLIKTPNYKIYTTIERDWVEEYTPYFFEAALQNYMTAITDLPAPRRQMTSFLFADRRQWMNKTREMLPDQADDFSRMGRGGYATQGITVLYYIDYWGTHDTFAIAAHEGWHQYTQTTFKHSLPIWLEEGVATYMEGFRRSRDGEPHFKADANRERRRTLQQAFYRKRMIPLRDLIEKSPQQLLARSKTSMLVYYSQVWALTRFLAEGEDGKYADGLAQALQDAASGELRPKLAAARSTPPPTRGVGAYTWSKYGPELVYAYFTRDFDQFEQEYLAFVEEIAGVRRW